MKLNTPPQNEAIVSNVKEVGEFRIRNSAKAFNILSSGLYANKIRAIIRELSCNAVDSHVEAGKKDTPFDVHLPNQLEPWFAIRDYGTGLDNNQVTNIYTTYFESTKTESNDFIGALGLGSKSPFSYTDNFTVTAIKHGKKGIYTAFINDAGVPSIALMTQEETTEPAGVEVKFAVDSYYEFDKFRQEAVNVYQYFSLRPVVSGNQNFKFIDPKYDKKDIVPGVHSYVDQRGCIAVMGNIAYPVQIPDSDKSLGDLRNLLNCGIEMHFQIGELDFQASREGLSYIPQTVASIKSKLEALNASLAGVLAIEANAIPNLWDRAIMLSAKREQPLWAAAVQKYVADTNLPTYDVNSWSKLKKWSIPTADLASKYNIVIRGLQRARHSKSASSLKPSVEYSDKKDANGRVITWEAWNIAVDPNSHFVVNDTKKGAHSRAKYHYRETECDVYTRQVYVLEPADRNKVMDTKGFFEAISNPPANRIFNASALLQKPRAAGMGKNVTIMHLERRDNHYHRNSDDMVWRNAGKAADFDTTKTYYYVPLLGFQMQSTKGYADGKSLYQDISSVPGLFTGKLYGVRKNDIAWIKTQKNWINIEDHVANKLSSNNNQSLITSLIFTKLENTQVFSFNNKEILKKVDEKSPYAKLVSQFIGVEKIKHSTYNIENLFRKFNPNVNINPKDLLDQYKTEINVVSKRYPLLEQLNTYRVDAKDIADYINMCDQNKGI